MRTEEIGVLTDFDGVAMDTPTLNWIIIDATYKYLYDKSISDRLWHGVQGKPLRRCFEIWNKLLEIQGCYEEFYSALLEHIEPLEKENLHLLQPTPGLVNFLSELKRLNIPIAIISSNQRAHIVRRLLISNLAQWFDLEAIVTIEDIPSDQCKPHPAPVYLAANKINREAQKCVVLGDSISDLKAGKAANSKVLGFTRYCNQEHSNLLASEADFLFNDFNSLTIEVLLSLFVSHIQPIVA